MHSLGSFGVVALSFGALVAAPVACSSSEGTSAVEEPGADATSDDRAIVGEGGDGAPSPDGAAPDVALQDANTSTHVVVGASGGTVATNSGVSIEVPAGALASDVTITVEEISGAPVPAGATSVGLTIQLGPEGQTFATPVKVTLPWNASSVPVVIAHAPRGGATWTPLSEGAGSDATHVWATTSSFSWFQPVYYQGSPDAPIVLANEYPVSPNAVALGSTNEVHLRGTGFRTDTVVTLFKDGVTTATVPEVTLTTDGLTFILPTAFTNATGLISIQAKNPQAAVGDATAIYAIATPVLTGSSPTSVAVTQANPGDPYELDPFTVTVTATDLPDNFALCREQVSRNIGGGLSAPASTGGLSKTAGGFSFVVSEIQLAGTHNVTLWCGGVSSNDVSLTFNVTP